MYKQEGSPSGRVSYNNPNVQDIPVSREAEPAYLNDLDPNQREAVLAPDDRPILVLAAAGSGKTRVLVTRAAYLIDVLNYPPSSIICTTFTKAAAEEIKARIGVLVGPAVAAGIQASTIHSLCLRILKNNLREVEVIAQAAQRYMVGRITEDLYKDHNIPERDSRRLGWRYWMAWIDWGRLNGISTYEGFRAHMDVSRPDAAGNRMLAEIAAEALARYQVQKGGMYDFTDMMTEARKLIDANPQVLDGLRQQYRYVLVDELQDTSKLQLSILRDIAHDRNLFLVGDVSQSLYSWREADPDDNVFTFAQRYEDGRIFHLPVNYRSTQEVVKRGKSLIRGNYTEEGREQYELSLSPSPNAQPGVEVQASYYTTARQEAAWLTREVERLLREEWDIERNEGDRVTSVNIGKAYKPEDIFVIARTNAALALPEEQLTMANIPAISTGGSYWAKRPVKDVVGILALAANRADDAAFEQVYDIPSPRWDLTTRRLGKRFLEDVRRGVGLSMWEKMLAIEASEKPHRKRSIKDFIDHMETIGFGLEEHTLGDVAELVCQDYIQYYVRREGPEAYEDVEVLEMLPDILGRMGTVEKVLEHVGKVQRDKAELASAKAVVLTTIHGVKGLERPVVFGIALSEGILPHWMSTGERLSSGMRRDDMPPSTYEGRLVDERCAAYVMITRAQEVLYVSGSYESGRKADMRPSRFFEEMGLVDPEPEHEEVENGG